MKYTEFGLDETKKSFEKGSTGTSFCLWCLDNVNKGFSMCFGNWVICQHCAEESTNTENNEKWELAKCFKCNNKDVISYRSIQNEMAFSICKDCIDWGKESFNRSAKTILITERKGKMETIEILQKCVVVGNVVKLPDIQLDPKTEYATVKKQLEAAGGKWNTRSQGFLFEEDPTEYLASLQSGKDINIQKDYQFYPTPAVLAGYLVSLAYNNHLVNISAPKILEPSAGNGAIVKEIVKRLPEVMVDCFELMELNRIKLQKVSGAYIIGNDFLEGVDVDEMNIIRGQYDAIIANPPFSKNQDIDHIKAMFRCLNPGGILVSIASKSWYMGSQKKQTDFKRWLTDMKAHVEEIMPGQFKESGTMVGGMIIVLKNIEIEKTETVEFFAEEEGTPFAVYEKPVITEKEETVLDTRGPLETMKDLMDEVKTYKEAEKMISEAVQKVKGPTEAAPPTKKINEELKDPKYYLEEIKETNKSIAKGLQELEQMLNDNPEEMEFFKKLQAVIGQSEINFTVRGKDDNLTVMIMPKKNNSGVELNNIKPLVLNGSAEEMDNGFFEAISAPIEKAIGLVTNLQEFEKSLEGTKTEATKAETTKSKRSSAKKVEAAPADDNINQAEEQTTVDPEEELRLKKEQDQKEEDERKAKEEELRLERFNKFQELKGSAEAFAVEKDYTSAIKKLKEAKEFTDEPDSLNEEIRNMISKRVELEMEEA